MTVYSLGKTLFAFALLQSVLQGQICLLLQVFLDFLICIPVPYNEKDIFFGCQFQKVSASSALLVGAQTWITLILNNLPWKRTEIILLFLRVHPSTAFWTLLLTMMATPFLLMDSCPQQQIQWSFELNSPIPVHFSLLIPKCRHSLLPSPISPLPIFLDSWT